MLFSPLCPLFFMEKFIPRCIYYLFSLLSLLWLNSLLSSFFLLLPSFLLCPSFLTFFLPSFSLSVFATTYSSPGLTLLNKSFPPKSWKMYLLYLFSFLNVSWFELNKKTQYGSLEREHKSEQVLQEVLNRSLHFLYLYTYWTKTSVKLLQQIVLPV